MLGMSEVAARASRLFWNNVVPGIALGILIATALIYLV
jgi:hypothetical protein